MDRKEIVRRYKHTPRPAGVYRVLHRPNGRMLVGASPDAPAMLNRVRAQLEMGSHPNRQLQSDWEAVGPDEFVFEVVDLLAAPEDPGADIGEDLQTLLDLWREKLQIDRESSY